MGERRRAQQMMNAIQGTTQALDCEKRTLIELNPARRPRKDDEISATSAQAFVKIACIRRMVRRLALFEGSLRPARVRLARRRR